MSSNGIVPDSIQPKRKQLPQDGLNRSGTLERGMDALSATDLLVAPESTEARAKRHKIMNESKDKDKLPVLTQAERAKYVDFWQAFKCKRPLQEMTADMPTSYKDVQHGAVPAPMAAERQDAATPLATVGSDAQPKLAQKEMPADLDSIAKTLLIQQAGSAADALRGVHTEPPGPSGTPATPAVAPATPGAMSVPATPELQQCRVVHQSGEAFCFGLALIHQFFERSSSRTTQQLLADEDIQQRTSAVEELPQDTTEWSDSDSSDSSSSSSEESDAAEPMPNVRKKPKTTAHVEAADEILVGFVTNVQHAMLPTVDDWLENVQLHQLLIDEIPSLEISNQNLGLNAVNRMFDLHNYAWAMVQACGPRAIRTPEMMQGIPDLSPAEQQRLQDSATLLDRSVNSVHYQPLCLHALQAISHYMNDPDRNLFPALIEGVSTGFQDNIAPSNVFAAKPPTEEPARPDLSVHWTNWQTAESQPELTEELVQEEIAKGWLICFPGNLEDAKREYPLGVAVGKLSIATSDTRPPRLVVDFTVSGTNHNCDIPEHQQLPSAKDVVRSFPLRGHNEELGAMGLDVRVKLQQSKREKLQRLILELLTHPKTSKKNIEKFIGLALWITEFAAFKRWAEANKGEIQTAWNKGGAAKMSAFKKFVMANCNPLAVEAVMRFQVYSETENKDEGEYYTFADLVRYYGGDAMKAEDLRSKRRMDGGTSTCRNSGEETYILYGREKKSHTTKTMEALLP
ncbi:unnamed protein product [Cladocopium goreaui]|uniref:Reverse transcriptase domain-containing protein n=1 Tax=Cladocopium goreaui TaxID=2562237 RepID=A0A9P1BXG7_9DINO|nr:unnamed protein product [Cladocopium goreaui]